MALLRLQNIGKIYVSEGNVTVGIRGVNLSFDRDEFVAITGASGSGKSTLLNVLSGMDTYEEGEMYIEEQPTSHYQQPDWETYREKYISFIFQDYNIIDSFTVLQNVELALMSIPDPGKRRRRAIELIERVGLKAHMKHKGSQLSGGQKQRTVIARALAKDSPIILADEPTGNLDSETSKDIIKLMKEISKGKLLIMVTHSFDQVEDVATRHVRVFDGAIEADRQLKKAESEAEAASEDTEAETAETAESAEAVNIDETAESTETAEKKDLLNSAAKVVVEEKVKDVSNGFLLGRSMFFSKPRLSIFLCFLMLLAVFGLFFATAVCGRFTDLFKKYKLFREEEGRLIIVHKDGTAISDSELQGLEEKYKAKGSMHYDYLLDCKIQGNFGLTRMKLPYDTPSNGQYTIMYDKDFGRPDLGRYPEALDEVFLYLPLYYKPQYGEYKIEETVLPFFGDYFKIVGIKYYANTEKIPVALFTEEGFRFATLLYTFNADMNTGVGAGLEMSKFYGDGAELKEFAGGEFYDTYRYTTSIRKDIDPDKIVFGHAKFNDALKKTHSIELYVIADATYARDRKIGFLAEMIEEYCVTKFSRDDIIIDDNPVAYESTFTESHVIPLYLGVNVVKKMFNEVMAGKYAQASLMFESDRQARKVAKELNANGYVALTTDETFRPSFVEILMVVVQSLIVGVIWFIFVVFLGFFINLCTHRTVAAFKEDMAIMRSMGIPVRVIRIGIYVRMFLSQVPAFIIMPIVAYKVYHTPKWNAQLVYLQPLHYVMIYVGMILLLYRVTRKQIRNLFGVSVKKSLRGGEEI